MTEETPGKKPHIKGFTIDSVSTRDMDDALSIQPLGDGWKVSVSIANVAAEVPLGSELDTLAHARTATRYFAVGNSPMLTRKLSDDTLSLWPDRNRDVVVIEIHLNGQAEVIETKLYEGLLRSKAKLSYVDIPGILQEPERMLHNQVTALSRLAKVLMAQRRAQGALVLYDINTGWITTEEGFLKKLDSREDTIGQILIQEFMILANRLVAAKMVEENVPFLFRNHTARLAAPDRGELLQTMEAALQGSPIANLDVIRERTHMLLNRAEYGATLKGHYGLSIPVYCHFTSPIRRYADLVCHRQVLAWLRKEPFPYTQEQIEAIGAHINEKNRVEVEVKRDWMKEKAAQKAERQVTFRQLDALNAKDFERVVKVQARNSSASLETEELVDADESLVEAFAKRVADNRLPLICLTVALAEAPIHHVGMPYWAKIHEQVVAALAKLHELAPSIFSNAAIAYKDVLTPELVSTGRGPDHRKEFEVVASVQFRGKLFSASHMDSPKKVAEQKALVKLVAQILCLPEPAFPKVKTADPIVQRAISVPKKAVYDGSKDPVAFLNEHAQALGQPPPHADFKVSGPDHMPKMVCTYTFGGKATKSEAGNKQEARRNAAKALIRELGLSN